MNQDERNQRKRGELWVDYLENDIEAPLKKDLDLVLTNSTHEQKTLKDLKTTKALIKATVSAAEPNDAFFDKLHAGIMSNLDKKVEDNVVVLPQRRWAPVAAAVAVVILGAVIWSSLRQQGHVPAGERSGDVLISESASDLEAFSDSLINVQSESDFFIEVAAQKIDSLPQAETNSLFDDIR
ncbi:MAG TPA: hypothetical protein VFV50_14940 [Bdellovibrionales bacterium]|nr:hypothetical protein [Bdellovibrionales bacterium]